MVVVVFEVDRVGVEFLLLSNDILKLDVLGKVGNCGCNSFTFNVNNDGWIELLTPFVRLLDLAKLIE